MEYDTKRAQLLRDPSTSRWLNQAIRDLDRRDMVDARNDLAVLVELAELRLKDVETLYNELKA